jgi:hypothetical protein
MFFVMWAVVLIFIIVYLDREYICINFLSVKIFKTSTWDFERKKGLSLYRVKTVIRKRVGSAECG